MSAACWVLLDERGNEWEYGEGIPHFATREEAVERIDEVTERGSERLTPSRLTYICVTGPECDECDGTFDDWVDYATHMRPEEADRFLEDCDWRKRGDAWLCGNCAHLGGEY